MRYTDYNFPESSTLILTSVWNCNGFHLLLNSKTDTSRALTYKDLYGLTFCMGVTLTRALNSTSTWKPAASCTAWRILINPRGQLDWSGAVTLAGLLVQKLTLIIIKTQTNSVQIIVCFVGFCVCVVWERGGGGGGGAHSYFDFTAKNLNLADMRISLLCITHWEWGDKILWLHRLLTSI